DLLTWSITTAEVMRGPGNIGTKPPRALRINRRSATAIRQRLTLLHLFARRAMALSHVRVAENASLVNNLTSRDARRYASGAVETNACLRLVETPRRGEDAGDGHANQPERRHDDRNALGAALLLQPQVVGLLPPAHGGLVALDAGVVFGLHALPVLI